MVFRTYEVSPKLIMKTCSGLKVLLLRGQEKLDICILDFLDIH